MVALTQYIRCKQALTTIVKGHDPGGTLLETLAKPELEVSPGKALPAHLRWAHSQHLPVLHLTPSSSVRSFRPQHYKQTSDRTPAEQWPPPTQKPAPAWGLQGHQLWTWLSPCCALKPSPGLSFPGIRLVYHGPAMLRSSEYHCYSLENLPPSV